MSADPEKLDPVVTLLKAKQAPQPPPAFFDQMSHRIRDGIEHPRPPGHTWWQRVISDMDIRAALVGVVVCALMLFALLAALKHTAQPPRHPVPILTQQKPGVIPPPNMLVAPSIPAFIPAAGQDAPPASSTPVLIQTSSNTVLGAPVPLLTTPEPHLPGNTPPP
ncbi:MAG: hypothetical protein JXQ71_04565 [Verrucomicrobia bacterium]|nr:hypothetical protein [Verrucomicrobiota bacterium]